ncbi:MAG: hypothetical protein IPK64_11580 [bacterium]|nr:hypothetical protein [bacterium]
MARSGFRHQVMMAVATLAVALTAPAMAAHTETFANGIRATFHDAAETAAMCVAKADGTREFSHPLGGSVTLAPATRILYPFEIEVVVAALADMQGFTTDVEVQVFVLDGIPAETGGSFARRGAMFLSPSFAPVDPAITSYITTHEMGHVLTWAFVDDQPGRWEAYARARGLDLEATGPAAPHAWRAREILAEDIRYLFGGTLATRGIGIENHALATPDRVAGLEPLLAGYFAGTATVSTARAHAFPNPCNPRTTLELVLPAGAAVETGASVVVHDLGGRLVRKLQGGTAANNRVAVTWDGLDDSGRPVPSGRYLFAISAAGLVARGAVTLVR